MGTWSLAWQPTDLTSARVGTARVEIQVTYADSTIQTVGPAPFTVRDQIA